MNRKMALALLLLAFAVAAGQRVTSLAQLAPTDRIAVGLVTGAQADRDDTILRAYEAFFVDNGIPYELVSADEIALTSPRGLLAAFPALVFADKLNARLPPGMPLLMERYAEAGGHVAFAHDVGTRNEAGAFLPRAAMTEVVGVDYDLYTADPSTALFHGPFVFSNAAAARRWDLPQGKHTGDFALASYKYGSLTYPLFRAKAVRDDVAVEARVGDTPELVLRRVGAGSVLWVGLPLGYLKAHSDAFPMQLVLHRWLVRVVGVPHLVPAPGGVGRLIVNLHLDSNAEWPSIPHLIGARLVRHSVVTEFDVTAGPDRDKPGDRRGLDACGLGAPLIRELTGYGVIGSHGGWAHNYFAWNVEDETISPAQITALILRNNECLSRLIGKPIRAFAAPDGAHPQPAMTNIIEQLGMNAYYYTGDTGMSATRAFSDGRMVSDTAWAFPVMPNGRAASLYEMARQHEPAVQVAHWLTDTARYAAEERSIMLLYSHGYDLLVDSFYDAGYGRFLDNIEALQRAGRLTTGGMSDSATFMQRFIGTTFAFRRMPSGVTVELANPEGLADVAFAAPPGTALRSLPSWLADRGMEGDLHVYAVRDGRTMAELAFDRREVQR
jgi:hypothetical protein